ncbi:MAG: DUF1847 domain-containing protein [Clostridiales bacterium]|nr:DUF1847 domain-containing protein [Clostridiales bacterium]
MDETERSCIDCYVGNCNWEDGKFPDFCLSTHMDPDVLADAMAQYGKEEIRQIAVAAAEVEADNYCKMTRLEETVEFAKKIGAKKIGIANRVGLLAEARMLAKILRSHGFEVFGSACKGGTQRKASIGIPERCDKVGFNMCNPVLQAKILNSKHTDLNILVGLCVGHDSLFYKYSEAPVTTLVAKDRVLGHNTVAALYQADKYYKKVFGDQKQV